MDIKVPKKSNFIDSITKAEQIEALIFKLDKKNAVFVSNMFYINMDFDGNYVKPLDNTAVFMNIFPEWKQTYIIFSISEDPVNSLKPFFKKLVYIYRYDLVLFKRVINNMILYYNMYSVITENKVVEKKWINLHDFEEQFPNYTKYKLLDPNLVIFII